MANRRSNQDRVTAPEADARLRQIAEACIRSGLPEPLADILAEGYIARLRRRVWEQFNDIIGSGDDVEALCGWKGPPRSLAASLANASYIRDIQGVYVCCDAVTEAPEYIKHRWRRSSKANYEAARSRADAPLLATVAPTEQQKQPEDVIAAAKVEGGEDAAAKEPGHKRIVDFWARLYESATGNKYPFRGRDFKVIADLIKLAGDIHTLEPVLRAYIKCREPFYHGWELRWLFRDYARFAVARGKHGRPVASKSEIPTERGAL